MITELRKKSQVTIPAELVRKFNLVPGDQFDVFDKDGMICFMPVAIYPKQYVDDLKNKLEMATAETKTGIEVNPEAEVKTEVKKEIKTETLPSLDDIGEIQSLVDDARIIKLDLNGVDEAYSMLED